MHKINTLNTDPGEGDRSYAPKIYLCNSIIIRNVIIDIVLKNQIYKMARFLFLTVQSNF